MRTAILLLGDFSVAWISLTIAVYFRRIVPMAFTRSLLAPDTFPLDVAAVSLFTAGFLCALGLAGFYRRRIMLRAHPVLLVALLIQIAAVAIGATLLEQPLPRTVLFAVPLIEALLFPLWRRLQFTMWPMRLRDTILVGDPAEIAAALAVLETDRDRRVQVIGYAGSAKADVGVPWLGPLADIDVRAAIRDVEEVICVWSEAAPSGRLELLRIRGPR
ncbi:MAG TPA: hypothetical protein VHY33_03885, partial [Thermoanaerobaculia bacterium]|nr:hypothetical protein [Thermoanaerobaculia bacterium]